MYKTKDNKNPIFMNDIFVAKKETGYALRSNATQDFEPQHINSVHMGEDSLRFLGCKLWKLIPETIKQAENLIRFKVKIRNWKPRKCPCKLCKTYVSKVGYIE